MKVTREIKKCVAFVSLRKANGDFLTCGTCFLIGRNTSRLRLGYMVTAKHVIEGIKGKGLEDVYVRYNSQENSVMYLETKANEWMFHDDFTVDIAVHPFSLNRGKMDHLAYPESLLLTDSESFFIENEIDVGDEVFIAGLFKHHHGKSKNLPIIRIGNIAALPGEKVQCKDHKRDAYLIEARSIGGLSGSPVFLNIGLIRHIKGETKVTQDEKHFLIGVIHGHYDSKLTDIDEVTEDANDDERVNTGIAIVTPVSKLIELFDQQTIKSFESKVRVT